MSCKLTLRSRELQRAAKVARIVKNRPDSLPRSLSILFGPLSGQADAVSSLGPAVQAPPTALLTDIEGRAWVDGDLALNDSLWEVSTSTKTRPRLPKL